LKKKLAVAMDDYRELVETNKYYVDKTDLIEELLNRDEKILLITRPRRFGKTLNMTMIREFFDISKDSKKIFEGTKIMKTEYASYINTKPMVFLTFKDCKGNNKRKILVEIKKKIYSEYERHNITFEDKKKIPEDILYRFEEYKEILKSARTDIELLEDILKDSVELLTQVLYEYYDKKQAVVIVDEYDTPFIEAKVQGCYDDVIDTLAGILGNTFKGNDKIERGILTGIQKIAQESIFSELNNPIIYTVVDEAYSDKFGLISEETKTYLEYFGLELNEDVKNYYDGYKFGNEDIYNPMSITNYIRKNGTLDSYWVNTSSNQLVKDEILDASNEFKEAFEELIEKGSVAVTINFEKTFHEEASAESLWGLLVNAGYVTIQEHLPLDEKRVRIPNNEVYKEFRRIVSAYTRISDRSIKNMFKALISKDIDKFKEMYKQIVLECTSFYDGTQKENSYHMLMLGMCVYLKDRFKVESNVESGHGRADISIHPLIKGDLNVVIEFKSKENEDLQAQAEEALQQIKDNKYYTGMKGDILLLGIAHRKKEIKMVHEMMHI